MGCGVKPITNTVTLHPIGLLMFSTGTLAFLSVPVLSDGDPERPELLVGQLQAGAMHQVENIERDQRPARDGPRPIRRRHRAPLDQHVARISDPSLVSKA